MSDWNDALDKVRDHLVEEMEVHYDVQQQNDIHYVRWHKIRNLIDELKDE